MTSNGVTIEQAAAVTPLNLREYALASGWKRVQSKRPERIILAKEHSSTQLIFPNDPNFDDYGRIMFDVLVKLSAIEDRPVPEVYADLLDPHADNVRVGVISLNADRGQIDFEYAMKLLGGFRECLLASAHSVIAPQRRHPKLNRADALDMIKGAKLNHSERSSYTISVSLPLRAGDDLLPGSVTETFTRQATKLFLRSVYRLFNAIESDAPEGALNSQAGEAPISANLCSGLLKMQPAEETADLRLGIHWAPTHPAPDMQDIPSSIKFRRDHFDRIADVYARLVPEEQPKPQVYVGTVERMAGFIGPSGRREGDVDLSLFHEGEVILARATLDPDQHAKADQAYMSGEFVVTHGLLERKPRINRLGSVSYFDMLPDEHVNGNELQSG